MRHLTHTVPALLLVLLLAGCDVLKWGKKKPPNPKPEPAAPTGSMTLIGIVEMVNPEQNYVLIRCEQATSLAPGTELIALDATGAQSKLALTPERKGLYLTADIKGGSPKVTNLVMQPKGTMPPPAPVEPPPTPVSLPSLPLTNPFPQPPPPPGSTLPLDPPLPQQPQSKAP
ncbi:MAG: hypothetical protein U0984_09150 [Prosthecobacter sp.]|nr:hypothetical protein [Prosthecobacter sp.]